MIANLPLRFSPAFSAAMLFIALPNGLFAQASASQRLVTLDGQVISATVESIGANGALSGPGVPPETTLEGLRRIEAVSPAAKPTSPIAAIVELAGGGRIEASSFVIDDELVATIKSAILGEIRLPIDALRSVRFGDAKEAHDSFVAATKEKSDDDRIFVNVEAGVQMVKGLVESISDVDVAFDLANKIQKLPRAKIYGIAFAVVGRSADHAGECHLTFVDNSTLWGKVSSLADGKLQMKLHEGGEVALPWNAVAKLVVRSPRLVFLSDLEPVDARHQPLVTLERAHQNDLSVGGRPLTLGTRTFDRGVGVASRSILTYEASGKYDLLAAVIGIDAETEGRGDCVFVVQGDGRELYRQRVSGKDEARMLQVPITGVDRVTLLVEPGEDLDLADHADWCDVRFVKNAK